MAASGKYEIENRVNDVFKRAIIIYKRLNFIINMLKINVFKRNTNNNLRYDPCKIALL